MNQLPLLVLLASRACGGPPHRAYEKDPSSVATVASTVLVVLDDEVKWQLELLRSPRAGAARRRRLRAQIPLRQPLAEGRARAARVDLQGRPHTCPVEAGRPSSTSS
jgi:hypothetical protein